MRIRLTPEGNNAGDALGNVSSAVVKRTKKTFHGKPIRRGGCKGLRMAVRNRGLGGTLAGASQK